MFTNSSFTSKENHSKGFSLLEILISGAVLAMVLVSLATLTSYTIKSSDQARVRTFAADLAQSRIDLFRFQRAMLGWGGLSQVLEARSYCLNGVVESAEAINFDSLPDGDNCVFETIPGSDISTEFKQVANVVIVDETGEINVEVTISWINDKGTQVDARSSFVLRKDSRETSVFVPVAPTATDVPPTPTPTTVPPPPQPTLAHCCVGDPVGDCFWNWICNLDCEWECTNYEYY